MKLFEQPEPKLRYNFNSKKAKRQSRSKIKKLRNKSIRTALKRNLEYGKELLNKCFGWEF